MKQPVIQFVDYSFQYRAQAEPTLHHINLTIYEGEKVLVVGPSGSGKSTLAHCINGLVPFFHRGESSGMLRIAGQDASHLGTDERSGLVGTVLQDPDGQFVGLTVAEDIAFKLENDGVPQAEMIERVKLAASLVGIDSHLGAAPHALSGGQKQRTTLAGVMVNDVGILLFDEPLANLDPSTGKNAIELIDLIHTETGKTIVIIEHRLEDVLHRPVDRIIVMSDGRIIADSPASELLCTDILKETGIREPLYLTALKYAECPIEPELNPEHISRLKIESCIEPLRSWYGSFNMAEGRGEHQSMLELERVDFAYEGNGPAVLQDISFQIAKGEMIGIVGKNGAGKSTLSRLICGFHHPTAGVIRLDGRDIRRDTIRERAERVGYVLQNPNQMISKTMLFDEVAFGLQVRGVSEDEIQEQVHHVLRVCGLYEMRNWPISALSFGQKKRVTIASILVLRPEILILDEPTAGQDFRHYNEMMEFLLELNRGGMTVIMITHDMHLLLEYAKRAIVLADGKLIADDRPSEILTDGDIIGAANLKETSVYELAERAGFTEPKEFVRRFIEYDRRMRER